MKERSHRNWALCGFILYLLILLVCGLIYANLQRPQTPLHLSRVSSLPLNDGNIGLTVHGSGLDKKLQAYLTIDVANRRAIVEKSAIWGQSSDIQIVGNRAYVMNLAEGVKIFDLKNPTTPVAIGKMSGKTHAWRGDVDERRIFLSSLLGQVMVCSLNERKVLYRINTLGNSFFTIHRGQNLFIAEGKAGLAIYDISGRWKARLLSRLPLPGIINYFAFSGDFLVASGQKGGLYLIDIHDTSHPCLRQTIAPQKHFKSITQVGNFIYAAEEDLKLDIFSLSKTGYLKLQSSIATFGLVRDFLLAGDRLYLAENRNGVSAMDVSDPANPQRVGFVGTPGTARGLAIYGNYLYVASGTQGIQIVDTRRFVSRKSVVSVATPGGAYALVTDGRWIYVADGVAGLQVIDAIDQKNLKIVAHLPTPGKAKMLVNTQNMLFMAVRGKGLLVIDVTNPLTPRVISRLSLGIDLSDLALRGTNLFASSLTKKLLRIDISNPEHLRLAETLDLPGKARRIAASGDDVFIAADNAGLQIAHFPLGQPGRLISAILRPWPMSLFNRAFGVAVRGGYAYVVQGEEGLQVVDILNPFRPKEVGMLPVPGQNLDISLTEQFAVLSSRWSGYRLIDISRPPHPSLAANIYWAGSKSGFKAEAGKLYTAGRSTGVSVFPLPSKGEVRSRSAGFSLTFKKPQYSGWYDLSISEGKSLQRVAAVLKVD